MADHEDVDNIHLVTENFFKTESRRMPQKSSSITLKLEFKNSLKVIDSQKNTYSVDESVLSSFRDTYADKNCNPVLTQTNLSASRTGPLRLTLKAKGARKSS